MSRSIPPPPRALIIGLAILTVICFLGGRILNHLSSNKTKTTSWQPVNQAEPTHTVEMRLWVPKEEGALRLKEEYGAKGYQVAVLPIQTKVQVPAGYIVADRLDPIAAKPAAEALSKVYHFQVTLKTLAGDKTLVQVGPIYKKKEDAEKLVQRLKQLGYDWHIESNAAENDSTQFEVRISQIPRSEAMALKNSLSNNGIKVEIKP